MEEEKITLVATLDYFKKPAAVRNVAIPYRVVRKIEFIPIVGVNRQGLNMLKGSRLLSDKVLEITDEEYPNTLVWTRKCSVVGLYTKNLYEEPLRR